MKRLLISALFSAIVLLVPFSVANAAPKTYLYSPNNRPIQMNFYISLFGGMTDLKRSSWMFEQSTAGAAYAKQSFAFHSNKGYQVALAPGFQYEHFRIEEELAYIDNDVDRVAQNNVTYDLSSGSAKAYLAMTNLYFDFNFGRLLIIPYVGVGAGWAHLRYNFKRKTSIANNPLKGHTNNFAYQGIMGLKYFITKRFSIHADYRYLDTSNNNRFTMHGSSSGSSVVDRIQPNYAVNSFNLGVTYHFPSL